MNRAKIQAAKWPPSKCPGLPVKALGQPQDLSVDRVSPGGVRMPSPPGKAPTPAPGISHRVQQLCRQQPTLSPPTQPEVRRSALLAGQSVGQMAARWGATRQDTPPAADHHHEDTLAADRHEVTRAAKDTSPTTAGACGPSASLWDLSTGRKLALLEARRQFIGLDVNGSLIAVLNELGSNDCVIAVCDITIRDREFWVSPRPGLHCFLNEDEIYTETLISHGSTLDVGDHFVRFLKSNPSPKFAPPSKPKRASMKPDDKIMRAPVNARASAGDMLSKRVKTPDQLANLTSSYIGHEVTVYTELKLSSKELDCLYKAITHNMEGNEEEISDFLRNYEHDKKDNDGRKIAHPGHIVYVLGYFLRISIEPVEDVLLWLKLLTTFSGIAENQTYFFLHGLPAIVQGTMSAYVLEVQVQLYCCQILANLAPAAELSNGKPPLREGAVELVVLAMKNHPLVVDVVRCGCQALSNITQAVTDMFKSEVYSDDTDSVDSGDSVISVVALLLGFLEFIKEHGLPATQRACADFPYDDVIQQEAASMRVFFPGPAPASQDMDGVIYDVAGPPCINIHPDDTYDNILVGSAAPIHRRPPQDRSDYQDIELHADKAKPVPPVARHEPDKSQNEAFAHQAPASDNRDRYTYAVVNKLRKSSSDTEDQWLSDTRFEDNALYDSFRQQAPPLPARPPDYDIPVSDDGAFETIPDSPQRKKEPLYSEIGSPPGADSDTSVFGENKSNYTAVTPVSNRSHLGKYAQNSPIYCEIPSPAGATSGLSSGPDQRHYSGRQVESNVYQDISKVLQDASGSYAEVTEPLNEIPEERIYDDISGFQNDIVEDENDPNKAPMRRGSLFSSRKQKERVHNLKGVAAQFLNRGKKYELNHDGPKSRSDKILTENGEISDGKTKGSNIKNIKQAASGLVKKIRKLSAESPEVLPLSKDLPGRFVQRTLRDTHGPVLAEMKKAHSNEHGLDSVRGDLVVPRKRSTGLAPVIDELTKDPSVEAPAARAGKTTKTAILKDLMRGKKFKLKKEGSE